MLEFDWLEFFYPSCHRKNISGDMPPPPNAVNYCLELNCYIKYMIFDLFIRIVYEKYFV